MELVRAFVHARRLSGSRVSAERIHVSAPHVYRPLCSALSRRCKAEGGAFNGSCEPCCPISSEPKGCLLSSVAMATTEICLFSFFFFLFFSFLTSTAPQQEGTVGGAGGGAAMWVDYVNSQAIWMDGWRITFTILENCQGRASIHTENIVFSEVSLLSGSIFEGLILTVILLLLLLLQLLVMLLFVAPLVE